MRIKIYREFKTINKVCFNNELPYSISLYDSFSWKNFSIFPKEFGFNKDRNKITGFFTIKPLAIFVKSSRTDKEKIFTLRCLFIMASNFLVIGGKENQNFLTL